MTLEQFIINCGSQEKAAHKIGVTLGTLRGWLQGRTPQELSLRALHQNEVEIRFLSKPKAKLEELNG